MQPESYDFLTKLANMPSPSGYEEKAAKVYRDYLAPYADKVTTDFHGNTIAVINPQKPVRVMISGHVDELGFLVKHVSDEGLLYVAAVGGHDVLIPFGQRVNVHGKQGTISGVMGRKAIHLMTADERTKMPMMNEVWVDIGAKDRAEALEYVNLGDPITYQYEMQELLGDNVCARGFDDKMGAWMVAEVLRELSAEKESLGCGLYSVATVQEEIGLRGAKTSAYGIDPTVGVAVDVTHSIDFPGADKKRFGEAVCGKGPSITRGPNINPVVFDLLMQTAKEDDIPVQIEVSAGGTGTDANMIQLNRASVATGLISIPLRYMHTPCEVMNKADLENGVKLIAGFIRRITPETDFRPLA